MEAWQNFLVAQIGASAALLGLLFVGVSLNLTKILSLPMLPTRALSALMLLLVVLVVALLLLIPGQPLRLLGAEVMAAGLVVTALALVVSLQSRRTIAVSSWLIVSVNVMLSALATLPYLVAAAMLFAGNLNALYWIAAAMVLSVIKAVSDAWVLLVEINR